MNFYKRHLGDYAKDAGHLSMLEHGAYTLLLDRYYTTEQPIPNLADAYRICRARGRDERQAVDSVLREFFVSDGGAFLNRRAEEEIAKAAHQRTVNQEVGKRGGRPKKTDSATDPITDSDMRSVTDSVPVRNPSQTPDSTEVSKKPQKRRSAPPCPEAVTEQTWEDWLSLRATKRAPVTKTVIDEAAREASKAGMGLDAFLRIWCARGSQGLQADWLKPAERMAARPIQAVVPEQRNAAAETAAYLAELDRHAAAAQSPQSAEARAKAIERMRRVAHGT